MFYRSTKYKFTRKSVRWESPENLRKEGSDDVVCCFTFCVHAVTANGFK